MENTKQFWGDAMVDEIIARVESTPELKKRVEENGYFIYDEKTPSGDIHVGSGRGWVIHDVLAKILRERGKQAKFVLSSDDHDPFDKPNKGMPEFDKYLGWPFRKIPSPAEGYKSWGDYYFMQSAEKLEEWGIEAELASTGDDYENGVFDKAIKQILDNYKEVQKIYEEIYDKPYNKIPFNPICENCGKVITTLSTAWDKEKELITYECQVEGFKHAKGCGHKGQISPYKGNGKLPWKVEWAIKWPSKGVIVETAGKDHFTKGGARTISIRISDRVLNYPPPYPSTATEEGSGYEFVNIGGKKMSTSKGKGISFATITEHVPAQILRFLMVTTKPGTVLDFDPSRKNDLLLLYDRYDTAERVYYNQEESDREEVLKRIYKLSHVGEPNKIMPPQVSLRHAGVIVQIATTDEEGMELLEKQGHLKVNELDETQKKYLKQRFAAARKWLEEFAPESEIFKVQEEVSEEVKNELSEQQTAALKELAEKLREKTFNDKELFEYFYELCQKHEIKNTEFFKAAYKVILNKTRGPKLANLILTVGQEKVIRLIKQL